MLTPQERFKEHLKESQKERNEQRPLYNAIRYYGKDAFILEIVEECSSDIVNEREKYWIAYYNSYENGYNATLGGDGKHYIDYDLVLQTYQKFLSRREVAQKLNINEQTVTKILKEKHIDYTTPQEVILNKYGKKVACYSLKEELISTFDSLNAAARFVKENGFAKGEERGIMSHIRDVSKGKRKTAYKYKWKFI